MHDNDRLRAVRDLCFDIHWIEPEALMLKLREHGYAPTVQYGRD